MDSGVCGAAYRYGVFIKPAARISGQALLVMAYIKKAVTSVLNGKIVFWKEMPYYICVDEWRIGNISYAKEELKNVENNADI